MRAGGRHAGCAPLRLPPRGAAPHGADTQGRSAVSRPIWEGEMPSLEKNLQVVVAGEHSR